MVHTQPVTEIGTCKTAGALRWSARAAPESSPRTGLGSVRGAHPREARFASICMIAGGRPMLDRSRAHGLRNVELSGAEDGADQVKIPILRASASRRDKISSTI